MLQHAPRVEVARGTHVRSGTKSSYLYISVPEGKANFADSRAVRQAKYLS